MQSNNANYKLIDRGFDKFILLIPGWALDSKIFGCCRDKTRHVSTIGNQKNLFLDVKYNYIILEYINPNNCLDDILNIMKKFKLEKISVLGLSLGGYIAYNFAKEHPQKIDEIILVGMREKYSLQEIEKVKLYLTKNKKLYLEKFYKNCFSVSQNNDWEYFENNLLEYYLNKFSLDELLMGLDYLGKQKLEPEILKNINVTFVNGKNDVIAPINDIMNFKNKLKEAKYIFLDNIGHICIPPFA
jgi:pimeloyl-ACP methyl ester carboxylesterase